MPSHVDLYNMFSHSAKHAWRQAFALAQKRKSQIGVEDIFLALLMELPVKNLLSRIKVNSKQAEIFINNYLKLTPALSDDTVKKIPLEAFAMAVRLHNHKIGSLMLLGGLLKATPRDNILQAIFTNIGLSEAKLELFAVWHLDLNYEFPPNSTSEKLLFCLRQAGGLEEHFGYFFELPAIEAAVNLSQGQTLKELSRATQQSSSVNPVRKPMSALDRLWFQNDSFKPPILSAAFSDGAKVSMNIVATRSIIPQGRSVVRDLQHSKTLQLLVRAGLLAKNKGVKIISENLVKQAAGK